jgi:HEAT repeat protein
VTRALRRATPERRTEIEKQLLRVVQNPDATVEVRRQSLLLILRVAGRQSVPVLVDLAGDPELGTIARRGLVYYPYPEVDKQLVRALSRVRDPEVRVGIIGVLGERGSPEVCGALEALLAGDDDAERDAAALSRIPGPGAVRVFLDADPRALGVERWTAGALACAERTLDRYGASSELAALYDRILELGPSEEVRRVVLRGRVLAQGAPGAEAVLPLLRSPEPLDRKVGAELVADLRDDQARLEVARALPSLPEDAVLSVLPALAVSGGPRLVGPIVSFAGRASGEVFIAACEALGELGSGYSVASVGGLLERARDETEAKAAADAVSALIAKTTPDHGIGALFASWQPEAATRAATLAAGEVLKRFPCEAGAEVLAQALELPDAEVRRAAAEIISTWPDARPLSALLQALRFGSAGDEERRELLSAYLRLGLRTAGPDARAREGVLTDARSAARSEAERAVVAEAQDELIIGDLSVSTGRSVEVVVGGVESGAAVYTDRAYVFEDVPPAFRGATFIRTAMDDKHVTEERYLTFTLSKPATVLVGFDSRAAQPPAWLSEWQPMEAELRTTDSSCRLLLYARDMPAGTVVLGSNMAPGVNSHYTVVIRE